MCRRYEQYGKCSWGVECTFAHGQKELNFGRNNATKVVKPAPKPSKPAVEPKPPVKYDYPEDDYNDDDLNEPYYNAKYKTEMCNNIIKTGHCSYEKVCIYAHSKSELRKLPEKFKAASSKYFNQHEPLYYEQ